MTSQTSSTTTTPVPGPQKNPLQWVQERLSELRAPRAPRAAPALKPPPRQKLHAPKLSRFTAFWGARLAVRSGIPLEDFLQHRLSQHLADLPVPPSRLPITIAVDDGGVIASTSSPASARAPWLESFLRAEGPAALGPDVQLAQADAARLAARVEAQRKRVDEVTRELEEVTRGADVADPADEAQAQQMGRPQVPPPLGLGLQLFALTLLLAETWQLAVPCLEGAGIRTSDLSAELHRTPMGVVLGSIFALGASASLFLFAHLALRRGLELFQAQAEARRRLLTALAAAAAALLAVAMAWSIAGVRPGTMRAVDLRYARWTLFLIALAIPAATAWMLRTARELDAARAEALAKARAWDHEHYRSYAELSRRAAVCMGCSSAGRSLSAWPTTPPIRTSRSWRASASRSPLRWSSTATSTSGRRLATAARSSSARASPRPLARPRRSRRGTALTRCSTTSGSQADSAPAGVGRAGTRRRSRWVIPRRWQPHIVRRSTTSPAMPTVATSSGAVWPDAVSACRAATAIPLQQGTSIFTTSTLFGAAWRKSTASFSA